MTDSIFTKYRSPYEKKIIYEPRTGTEMENATLHKVPVYEYSELCNMAARTGTPTRMLAQMFKRAPSSIVLLQDPQNMSSGHWISITCNRAKKEIYFFSTYGGKPDVEKNKWIKEDDLRESGQIADIFRDGLRDLQLHGWEIHYNDYPYQKPNDKTAVCGIYTAAFIRSGLNPEQFKKETLALVKRGINPAVYYYDKYF